MGYKSKARRELDRRKKSTKIRTGGAWGGTKSRGGIHLRKKG